LWVQQHGDGPLVRVTEQGVQTVVWTEGLMLRAAGPSAAWCTPEPPGQELVTGPGAQPADLGGGGRLLRVDHGGNWAMVQTPTAVMSVRADPGLTLVEVQADPWRLHHLGADTYEVVRSSRWLGVPEGAPPPTSLTMQDDNVPDPAGPPRRATWGRQQTWWFRPDSPHPIVAAGQHWRLGTDPQTGRGPMASREVVVACFDSASDRPVRSWSLGRGKVWACAPTGHGLVVSLARPHVVGTESARTDLLLVREDDEPRLLLPGDAVEVSSQCWPLSPHPIEEDSYTRRVLERNADIERYWNRSDGTVSPLATGISNARTELVGHWPETVLQWSFSHPRYPGLRLRRRVRLFDELGRIDAPEHPEIQLMEDLDTDALPDATQAHDGILTI
jgi:hypothetical protein